MPFVSIQLTSFLLDTNEDHLATLAGLEDAEPDKENFDLVEAITDASPQDEPLNGQGKA